MKITFLLTQDLESPSGLGRYRPMAAELARLGHEVCVIALHPDFAGLTETQQQISGVRVHYAAQMHVRKVGNVKTYYSPLKSLWIAAVASVKLSAAALKKPADVVIIGKPHPMNSIAGVLAQWRYKAILVVDCDDNETGSNRFARSWQKWGVQFFETKIPRLANLVTTNAQSTRQTLLSNGVSEKRLIYLPNGVDRDRFSRFSTERSSEIRRKLGWQKNRIVIYLGSLSLSNHPVDLLIEAFAQVTANLPDTRLLIVGGGEDLPKLVSLVAKLNLGTYVYLAGRVPPEETQDYLRAADVSVDPVHDNEAARGRNPLKMYESWVCGIPFITSNVGDRADIIRETGAALVVPAGDPSALASGIQQVLADPDLQNRLNQNGLLAIENYFWDHLIVTLNQRLLSPDVN